MKILLGGFGVVGRAFARLLGERRADLYARHGLAPALVGVLDSRGAAEAESGLDVEALLAAKEREGTVAALPGRGVRDVPAPEIIAGSDAQLYIEATPTSVRSPGPAFERLKAAFRSGKHAISVNKGPLAVAFPALRELARHNRVEFRFSGTVGGGTPVLALAQECARGDEVLSVRAVLNGTTNYILWRMDREGLDFERALAEAVRLGYAEADPSADIDGIDTATKLVILANGVLGRSCTLSDVSIRGIRGIARERIEEARRAGRAVKLMAEIGERLSVEPREVPAEAPLNVPANLNCLTLTLRTGGEVSLVGRGAGGPETATAILRDLLDIWHTVGGRA
ncbi:MAG TPA: homoserine dehydrogenase [Planctomycetota bacterium]|nr:homoserine dehydrogenase [Planctomycetota bacterium]